MLLFTYVLLFNRDVKIWKSSTSRYSGGASDLCLYASNDLFHFRAFVGLNFTPLFVVNSFYRYCSINEITEFH